MSDFDEKDAFVDQELPTPSTADTESSDLRYKYEKLREGQIRSVQITGAGDENDSLKLYLEALDLVTTAHRKFIAVSYIWGTQTKRVEIKVNDAPLSIGANCYHALIELSKHYDKNTCFWIDAICINQNDVDEKNQQVQLMSDIFRRARAVVSVVGPHENDSAFLFKVIRLFHERNVLVYNEIPRILFDLMDVLGDDESDQHTRPGSQGSLVLNLEYVRRASEALMHFSNRKYFRRLWIIQELTMAEEVKIICGDNMLGLHELEHFCAWLSFSRFNSLYEYGFTLPENVRDEAQSLKDVLATRFIMDQHSDRLAALQHDDVRRALWYLWGTAATFLRFEFKALPMWTVIRARDAYRRPRWHKKKWYHGDNKYIVELFEQLKRSGDPAGALPYLKLLQDFQDWGCSEVRDMLFGLLSISSFPEWFSKNAMPIYDYKQTVLQTAMEAIRVTDLYDNDKTMFLLARIALICKVFSLDHTHRDIQRALEQREHRDLNITSDEALLDDSSGLWRHKYDLECASHAYPLWKFNQACFNTPNSIDATNILVRPLVGSNVQKGDCLLHLMTGWVHLHGEDAEQDQISIWLVIRRNAKKAWEVVGQAHIPTIFPQDDMAPTKDGPSRCTLDLGDLVVMFCMARKMLALREKCAAGEDIDYAREYDFLNFPVCHSEQSTWFT